MRRIEVQCGGLSPILMDPMTEDVLEGLRTGVRPPEKKDKPIDEIAASKIYRDPDTDRIGLPSEMLIACLVGAGRRIKNGKKQISTATDTSLFDFLSIQETFLPFTNIPEGTKEEDEMKFWRADKRRGVGNTGVAVCVIRPSFKDWEFKVVVEFDDDKVNEDTIRKLFEVAGSAVGVGSFRPSKKGPFGRFAVKNWVDRTPGEWQRKGRGQRTGGRLAELEEANAEDNGKLVESGV